MNTQQTLEQIEESIKSLKELRKTLVEMKCIMPDCELSQFHHSYNHPNCTYNTKVEDEMWKPEEEETFFYLDPTGRIKENELYEGDSMPENADILKMGNVFKTKEEAEKYKLRLQSMAYKPYLPKDGEEYWFVDAYISVDSMPWGHNSFDFTYYLLGRIRKTKEECEEWIKKFSSAWEL